MRVKGISVKKLFGVFDHSIPLNMEERITIIHGPNGYGKTIMLRMLDGFFNMRYAAWRTTPFEEFRIDFEDESYVRIQPFKNSVDPIIDVYLVKPGAGEKVDQASVLLLQHPAHVHDDYTTEFSVDQENYERRTDRLGISEKIQQSRKSEPEWLSKLRKSVNIHFIRADRLLKKKTTERQGLLPSPPKFELAVDRYAKELTEVIQAALAEYGEVSQALDRTFPARVIKESPTPSLSSHELRQKLRSLEEKRAYLIGAGLLDSDDTVDGQLQQDIDDRTKSVLSVYVGDTEKKLGVLGKLAAKIDLFRRIIDQRFLYKKMSIDREKGLSFTTLNDRPLPAARLSSGEQHELVLYYELLFKVEPDSLVLIDEPELSFHIVWQQRFLEDLQEITRLSSIDALIATHAPSIIHDRWDLTVELKGPSR
ncbi:MAG TPA: AAA family ATPase [Blastocatellia bacterium]|jgi:Predicted ATP-binding protein involved in virulence